MFSFNYNFADLRQLQMRLTDFGGVSIVGDPKLVSLGFAIVEEGSVEGLFVEGLGAFWTNLEGLIRFLFLYTQLVELFIHLQHLLSFLRLLHLQIWSPHLPCISRIFIEGFSSDVNVIFGKLVKLHIGDSKLIMNLSFSGGHYILIDHFGMWNDQRSYPFARMVLHQLLLICYVWLVCRRLFEFLFFVIFFIWLVVLRTPIVFDSLRLFLLLKLVLTYGIILYHVLLLLLFGCNHFLLCMHIFHLAHRVFQL